MAMWTSGAYGLVYTVNTTNDVIVTGACANGTAGCSLRGAITEAEANPGEDQIVLAIPSSDPGCVDGVCTINLTAQLPDISRDLSISGPGPEQMIVRRATGGDYRIFRSSAIGPVSFTGFTISQGSVADTLGGGILNASIGTMTIDNCIISNNRAYRTVETSSPRGGGIANAGGGRVDITNSTITGNEANGTGGGIFNDALSVVTVRNSTLSGNGTSSSAGFVFLGGAIMNASGTVNLTNSTITGNNASGPGGAIHNVDTMTITNCTISGNSATNSIPGGNQAGGIYNLFGTTINMKGNIVALNIASDAAPDVEGNFSSSGFNLIGKNDDSSGFNTPTDRTGTIAAPLDPKLDPNGLQDNGGPTKTILLLEGSPAIDQGTSATLTEDQRGTGFPAPLTTSQFQTPLEAMGRISAPSRCKLPRPHRRLSETSPPDCGSKPATTF